MALQQKNKEFVTCQTLINTFKIFKLHLIIFNISSWISFFLFILMVIKHLNASIPEQERINKSLNETFQNKYGNQI